jgi:hypothetical protein
VLVQISSKTVIFVCMILTNPIQFDVWVSSDSSILFKLLEMLIMKCLQCNKPKICFRVIIASFSNYVVDSGIDEYKFLLSYEHSHNYAV